MDEVPIGSIAVDTTGDPFILCRGGWRKMFVGHDAPGMPTMIDTLQARVVYSPEHGS